MRPRSKQRSRQMPDAHSLCQPARSLALPQDHGGLCPHPLKGLTSLENPLRCRAWARVSPRAQTTEHLPLFSMRHRQNHFLAPAKGCFFLVRINMCLLHPRDTFRENPLGCRVWARGSPSPAHTAGRLLLLSRLASLRFPLSSKNATKNACPFLLGQAFAAPPRQLRPPALPARR